MAMTTLGDLFAETPTAAYDVVQSFMDRDPVTRTPFFDSGLLVNDPLANALAAGPAMTIELPYWGNIDATVEPNYSNDVYEDVAVPRAISTGYLRARNTHLNEGFGAMSLVQEVTGKDPLARIAARLDLYWRQEVELRIVATVKGLVADNIAANASDMVFDAGATVDLNAIIDAQLTMGDAFDDLAGLIMNSKVFAAYLKSGFATQENDPATNRLVRRVNGLPVIVNDTGTNVTVAATNRYLTVLMGRGAFAYGMAMPRMALEYEREAARGNGGGADTLWTRRNMIVHPLGFDFSSTSITGNGSETVARGAGWTDLQNAANWERKATRKQIPIAFMLSNV